ncbi:hypothetical protein M5E86_02400 [Blautia wexlerae]|nr:hypothetical protein M5E86_02400 [Blautia wexlerae]
MTANQKSGQQRDIFAPHDAPVNTDMPTLEQKAKGNKRLTAYQCTQRAESKKLVKSGM